MGSILINFAKMTAIRTVVFINVLRRNQQSKHVNRQANFAKGNFVLSQFCPITFWSNLSKVLPMDVSRLSQALENMQFFLSAHFHADFSSVIFDIFFMKGFYKYFLLEQFVKFLQILKKIQSISLVFFLNFCCKPKNLFILHMDQCWP